MPSVFISFATEDLDFVNKFFTRLKRLGLDIWDYTSRNDEIPLGEDMKKFIAQQIKEVDYVIPIISAASSSLQKEYVQFEMERAIDYRKNCFPVLLKERKPQTWEGVFKVVKNWKQLFISTEDEQDFENKICNLCTDLNVEYQPDITDHKRLPLFGQLQKELKNKFFQDSSLLEDKGFTEELLNSVNDFNLAYSLSDWEKSLLCITDLISFARKKLKNCNFYYPLIVKGACELQLNLIEEAKKTFVLAGKSPEADENAYGGLAHVHFRESNYTAAMAEYQKALERCPKNQDIEIIYNLVLTATEILAENNEGDFLKNEAANVIAHSGYLQRLESYSGNNEKEKIRFSLLVGIAYSRIEEMQKALNFFANIYEKICFQIPKELFIREVVEKDTVSAALQAEFKKHGFAIGAQIPVTELCYEKEAYVSKKYWLIAENESIYLICGLEEKFTVYYREIAMICEYATVLTSLSQTKKALSLLQKSSSLLKSRILYHRYALELLKNLYILQAKLIYKNFLCTDPIDKQFLIEYSLLVKSLNEKNEMIDTCKLIINTGPPRDRKDCYYHGYAYYLLEQKEAAHAYYRDSLNYDLFYSETNFSS